MAEEKAIPPKAIPKEGLDKERLLETMRGMREGDADFRGGRTWSLVYHVDEDHHAFLEKAYDLFFSANGLNPFAFKSLKRMEAEVVRMTATLLHGDENVVGTMTSGGTESILMAVKAARDRARLYRKWPRRGEVVAPRTIHPAFAKACHYFGLELRRAPVGDDLRADVRALERLVSHRTVLVAASAPQYAHGMVDPIEEIGAMAARRRVPFHVDACFGGFMLPWLERLGHPVPVFDFRVPGVTSMSADVHKYGYAAKGASTVLYRDMSYLEHQFFVDTEFPGGIYISPTMAGTRPGGAIAAAWAALHAMGEDGYLALAERALDATKRLEAGVAAIPGLCVLGSEHATVVSFGSDAKEVDIYAVADELGERGWVMERQQLPPSLHLTVNANNGPVVDDFLTDLRSAVDVVRASPHLAREREAALYGMMAKVPFRGAVRKSVLAVMQELYGPHAAEPDLTRIAQDDDAKPLMRLMSRYGDRMLDLLARVEDARATLRRTLSRRG